MFAICIEASHQRGMGHLFRALNLIDYLKAKQEEFIVLINQDVRSRRLLEELQIPYKIVDLWDQISDWETAMISKYEIDVWINDRLNTDKRHAENVKKNAVMLATFDDEGEGADFADIHFAGLILDEDKKIKGKKIFRGLDYLVLNKEIEAAKRLRTSADKILITLGGSDTYGVTVKVVQILKSINKAADVLLGPSFKHEEELQKELTEDFTVIRTVPSLIQTFRSYDLAITGGGITPFEANASGLPCIIIANELHEIQNGIFLEQHGCSVFAGYYENICVDSFKKDLDIEKMSQRGMQLIHTEGTKNIYNKIKEWMYTWKKSL